MYEGKESTKRKASIKYHNGTNKSEQVRIRAKSKEEIKDKPKNKFKSKLKGVIISKNKKHPKKHSTSTVEQVNRNVIQKDKNGENKEKHFVFPDAISQNIDEEIFADASQFCEPDWMNKIDEDILPYNTKQEDDLGLSIRGIRLRPELAIEINEEQEKGNSPKFDKGMQLPSPISLGGLSPLNIIGRGFNFMDTMKNANEFP